jgi:hypothetical protein
MPTPSVQFVEEEKEVRLLLEQAHPNAKHLSPEEEKRAAIIASIIVILCIGFSIYILANTGDVDIPDSERPHDNGRTAPLPRR